jgi:hypothetical protein
MFGIDYTHNFFTVSLSSLGVDRLLHFYEGWLGVTRAAVMAVCLMGVTGLLTRCRIRLQL